jgi:hypothetical protein
MHACAIINSNAKRNNAACRVTKNDGMQEIPTPQGFLVFQNRTLIAHLMLTAASAIDDRRNINVASQCVNQAVKKI